jgi:hypothetical protein
MQTLVRLDCSRLTAAADIGPMQLNTCFTKLNVNELFDSVLVGLTDSDEVKLLALLMAQRLAGLAEGLVAARLDELVDSLGNIAKPIVPAKDDTEQDVQRKVCRVLTVCCWFAALMYSLQSSRLQEDSQKMAMGCVVPLAEISSPQVSPKFDKLINDLARDPRWHALFGNVRR